MSHGLIIGAGIIGLLIARELRKAGFEVTVLDRDQPGRQASWASAGIISARVPRALTPHRILHNLSVELWPTLAAELREETGMDVEYRENGCLIPAFDDETARILKNDIAGLRAMGLAAEYVDGAALREAEPSLGPAVIGAQLLPGGNVENRRAVQAAALSAERAGVRIVTGAQATEIIVRGNRAIGVRTSDTTMEADIVVIAAGSWSGRLAGIEHHLPIEPSRGQILSLRANASAPRRVVLKENDPYLVPRVDGRLIVGATRERAGYDRSLTAGGVAWLLSSAIDMIPGLAAAPIVEMWTGFRPISPDGLPLIGPYAMENLYAATGHGASGVGPAPGTAALLTAIILGNPTPILAQPYRPDRFSGAMTSG